MKHPTTTTIKLGALRGASYNSRQITPAVLVQLQNSIREFGFVEPVVARKEDGLILGGHQRVAAYRALLLAEGKIPDEEAVPVVLLTGVSDARAKVLNLALNKISGEWDYEKLGSLLADLVVETSEVSLSGFTDTEIEDITGLMASMPEPAEVDIEAGLAANARRFVFDVGTDEDAATCRQVLARYGMSGPGSASAAFVAALKACPMGDG